MPVCRSRHTVRSLHRLRTLPALATLRAGLRFAASAGLACTAAGWLLCAPVAASAAALPEKTLVFCSDASPAGFDPAQFMTSVENSAAAYTVYNRLVEFKQGATTVEPGLAQSWDVSQDGLVYTFHLRRGVKFHTTATFKPTRDFDAQDVLFTFERMRNANQPFAKAYPVTFPYFVDLGLEKNIAKIDAPDPYTVRFTLRHVDAPFLSKLAMPFASVISAEYANQLLANGNAVALNTHPVGTGPFIFVSYTKDSTIRFEGNADYWQPGAVRLAKLVFAITPDAAAREAKLRANECQLMSNPLPSDVRALQSDPDLKVAQQVGFNLAYLAYNTTHPPLDQRDVRAALDMAIDKRAIVASVYQGSGEPASHPMPPTQWGYDRHIADAPYDPAKAKALLDRAGFKDGFELTLWAMPVQRAYNPNARLMAEMIQSDWARIGVRARIVTYEWAEYVRRARAGEHDAVLLGLTGDYGDPDTWLGVLLSCGAVNGGNFAKWCYKPYDDLIVEARESTDVAKRTRLYDEAQQIFAQQVPFTPIAHSIVYQPMRKRVTGFKIDPFGPTQFWNVGLQ